MVEQPPLILLIEEDPTLAEITSLRLELLGYQVEKAEDGPRALETVGRHRPQLIIVDLASHEHDGLQLLNHLSSEPLTSEIPLLLFSASADLNDVEQAFAAGAKEYVVKPYDPAILERKIEAMLTADA